MTTAPTDRRSATRRERSRRGQSLVEFALVLPMLLVLLLGIADFGRVFTAGIAVEALARNASEAAAQEFLQLRRASPGSQPPPGDYQLALDRAKEVACEEASSLPNHSGSGGGCSMPLVGACIVDEYGQYCSPPASPEPQCSTLTPWPPVLATPPAAVPTGASSGPPPYVHVRACYRFTTLFPISDLHLPMNASLTIGDIWLQKERSFVVADY